ARRRNGRQRERSAADDRALSGGFRGRRRGLGGEGAAERLRSRWSWARFAHVVWRRQARDFFRKQAARTGLRLSGVINAMLRERVTQSQQE
ncbi:MAG TPA: hypothetical protein VFQ61_08340, partial [Polyangiaceae bacterium]|nr:hypothetical protein [Polyangiaceae bacterium]